MNTKELTLLEELLTKFDVSLLENKLFELGHVECYMIFRALCYLKHGIRPDITVNGIEYIPAQACHQIQQDQF